MPNGRRVSLLKLPDPGNVFARLADQIAILAKVLVTNNFQAACGEREQSFRIRLGVPSFQKIN